jgi:ribosome-associated protein
LEPLDLARRIVDTLEDKKGEDIMLLDLRDIAPITDFFVIASGTSDRNLKALLDAVVEETRPELKTKPKLEGRPGEGWLLADFGGVILHLFSHDQRDYYNLEDLWTGSKVLLHVQ